MKKRTFITSCILVLGTFLVGCGPSKDQFATQTALAETATFEALLTSTHMPVSTPTLIPTPTSTSTLAPLLTVKVVSYNILWGAGVYREFDERLHPSQ